MWFQSNIQGEERFCLEQGYYPHLDGVNIRTDVPARPDRDKEGLCVLSIELARFCWGCRRLRQRHGPRLHVMHPRRGQLEIRGTSKQLQRVLCIVQGELIVCIGISRGGDGMRLITVLR